MRLLILACLTMLAAVPLHAADRPNVVIFISDDLGWADCSVYGKMGIRTPNMERIAAAGVTFTHAFVDSPSCAPARGALLTGLYPARNGAMFNHTVPDPKFKRWPAYFKDIGYEVVAIGKVAHYATVTQYGFDHASHFKYHEDTCIDAAVDWLNKRQSDKPLCLLVGTNWPHVPWPQKQLDYKPGEAPLPPVHPDTATMRDFRARYATAVGYADRDLGLVYDAAKKTLGDNALFLFTADHGSQFPFGKWNLYDMGLRSPLLAVWPGKIKPGTKSGAMVTWADILPTCLDAVGAKPPETGTTEGQISGKSFLPALLGTAAEHHALVFGTQSGDGKMNNYPMRSVRSRDWKYIRNLAPETEFTSHVDKAQDEVRNGYWLSWLEAAKSDPAVAALVNRYHHRPAEELYDLSADPWEQKNLAADPSQAARLKEMRDALDGWMKDQGDEGLKTEAARKPKAK
jgi:N-sulfoglucosamine sulfohydrolase